MQKVQGDFRLSMASMILVLCMLMPAFLNLAHAIHGHNGQTCASDIALHLHETEFDCEFQKYKLTKQFYTDLQNFDLFVLAVIRENTSVSYSFLSSYQQLHFSLRGPPSVT